MDHGAGDREERFGAYSEALAEVIGHADREHPLRDYCLGLLMPGERKSVEPIAALVAPARVSAEHQSLLHFVGQAPWSDEAVLRRVRDLVLPALEREGPITAWIVDDTGFAKKGVHSVGVARQYCGRLGKQDNCQVAVTLSVANPMASLPVAYRLYLPEAWAADPDRRAKAGVPDEVTFKTKPEIALDQIQGGEGGRGKVRDRSGGCGLWRRRDVPRWGHRARPVLCGGGAVDPQRVAARSGAAGAQTVERPRATALAHRPRS